MKRSDVRDDIAILWADRGWRFASSGLRLLDRQDASRAIDIIENEMRQAA